MNANMRFIEDTKWNNNVEKVNQKNVIENVSNRLDQCETNEIKESNYNPLNESMS